MTVAEAIAELEKQPQDAVLTISYTVEDGDWSQEKTEEVNTIFGGIQPDGTPEVCLSK
jgi:hypothetical protein